MTVRMKTLLSAGLNYIITDAEVWADKQAIIAECSQLTARRESELQLEHQDEKHDGCLVTSGWILRETLKGTQGSLQRPRSQPGGSVTRVQSDLLSSNVSPYFCSDFPVISSSFFLFFSQSNPGDLPPAHQLHLHWPAIRPRHWHSRASVCCQADVYSTTQESSGLMHHTGITLFIVFLCWRRVSMPLLKERISSQATRVQFYAQNAHWRSFTFTHEQAPRFWCDVAVQAWCFLSDWISDYLQIFS